MLEDQNNTMIFLWEIYPIFMQTSSIVLVLQHGRRAHTLYNPIKMGLGWGGGGGEGEGGFCPGTAWPPERVEKELSLGNI